ncbi:hypothetical protein A2U01_0047323, partial [Trifolium medium]|nr:hypothetical protein [Trifolium medium]
MVVVVETWKEVVQKGAVLVVTEME